MSTYPTDNRSSFVEWCQAHDAVFYDNSEELGLTKAQAGEFEALTLKSQIALVARQEAVQVARVATQELSAAIRNLRKSAGDVIRTIRAKAEHSKTPLYYYNLAQISPPAAASPSLPPATPKNLSATLDAARGALTLRWKAANPSGTSGTTYLVRRRLPLESEFIFLGASGSKTFDDDTLPAGVEQVEYTVQGIRGKRAGALSAVLLVRMGVVPATWGRAATRHHAEKPPGVRVAAASTEFAGLSTVGVR